MPLSSWRPISRTRPPIVSRRPELRDPPIYPRKLKEAGISGSARVGFIVETDGTVSDVYVVDATNEEFGVAAMAAALKWRRFRPLNQIQVEPTFYNQHSKFGRAFFMVEKGELSVTSRIGRKRIERKVPLRDLSPDFERGKERYPIYSIFFFALTAIVAFGVPPLARRLQFIDEMIEAPAVTFYAWMFGLLLAGIFSYRAVAGLAPSEIVIVRHRQGLEPVLIAKDKNADEQFELFVHQLFQMIREARLMSPPATTPPESSDSPSSG